jgi:cellobiose epimerase
MKTLDNILKEMSFQLDTNLLKKWYPMVIDNDDGGYYSNLNFDFQLGKTQEKMIVTQARHVWTLSKASEFYNNEDYKNYALHGFEFLMNKMWDKNNGGFYQILDKYGNFSDVEGWHNEKRVYGNAYGLYGLSALYKITDDKSILKSGQYVFDWIEKYAYDTLNKGYFQFFTEDNTLFNKNSEYKSIATDAMEVGFKDQNSSIHLLEAFTEFYKVNSSPLVRIRLEELLFLIRDRLTTEKGYLQLFFENNWKAVSFKDAPKELREANYRLDHVSFGHDYETAFLLLESSHALGITNDLETLKTAKKMVDHALENGWDEEYGGFFEEGYYFANDTKCKIIKETKNWWAQAEALNIFLLMSKIFPDEKKYVDTFVKEWEYIKNFIIDNENGDWYWGGLDKEPFYKTEPKGKIWKGTYHNGRALMNCIIILADEDFPLFNTSKGFKKFKKESEQFINHWIKVARSI